MATLSVLKGLRGRVEAISFRVPTSIVAASDLSVVLNRAASAEEINSHFAALAQDVPQIFGFEQDPLVSIDYRGTTQSAIVDGQRTKVLNGLFAKMVVWYDNEWGYSNRVVDLALLLAGDSREHGAE